MLCCRFDRKHSKWVASILRVVSHVEATVTVSAKHLPNKTLLDVWRLTSLPQTAEGGQVPGCRTKGFHRLQHLSGCGCGGWGHARAGPSFGIFIVRGGRGSRGVLERPLHRTQTSNRCKITFRGYPTSAYTHGISRARCQLGSAPSFVHGPACCGRATRRGQRGCQEPHGTQSQAVGKRFGAVAVGAVREREDGGWQTLPAGRSLPSNQCVLVCVGGGGGGGLWTIFAGGVLAEARP